MAIINYKDLNLANKNVIKTFKWGDKDIEILGYLPVEDRYAIVMITLQKSFENGYYNPIKTDMFFHLNLIYAYTNIIFSDEDRANESELFDKLVSSGFLDEFLKNFDRKIYQEMATDMETIAKADIEYRKSFSSVVSKFIEELPANAEKMKEIVDTFDPEKYQAVIDFAQAANGGRPIS